MHCTTYTCTGIDCSFDMSNERNGDTHLWAAASNQSNVALRLKSVILNYKLADDVLVSQGSDYKL